MEVNEDKQKRKVHRSPSYPAFALEEAIAKAQLVYQNERRASTTADVIASHVGYSSATGPGGRAVSALRQYGLIEESSGKYRLSDTGYTLVHFDRDTHEWKTAAGEAARHPTLFLELLSEYPDGLPSDATLRNDLLKRGFNPSSIGDVVSIFRDSMSLAFADGNRYHEAKLDTMTTQPVTPPTHEALAKKAAEVFMAAQSRQDVFSLAEGTVTIQWPASLSKESYADLSDWLDILKRKIGRSVKSEGVQ